MQVVMLAVSAQWRMNRNKSMNPIENNFSYISSRLFAGNFSLILDWGLNFYALLITLKYKTTVYLLNFYQSLDSKWHRSTLIPAQVLGAANFLSKEPLLLEHIQP